MTKTRNVQKTNNNIHDKTLEQLIIKKGLKKRTKYGTMKKHTSQISKKHIPEVKYQHHMKFLYIYVGFYVSRVDIVKI